MAQARAYGAINKAKRNPSLLLPGKLKRPRKMVQRISDSKTTLYKNQVFELLLVCLLFTLLAWYLKYLWGRRRLYKHAQSVPGPFALPLIGSALEFFRHSNDILTILTQYFNTYPGLFRVWFGTRLFYGISDPHYIEILLNHQQALKKEDLYRLAEPMVGGGLFTQKSVRKWKIHRKLIGPTFNQKILDQFVEVFREQSEILNQVLKGNAGKGEFDLFHVVSKCTLDIICETAMGVKIHAQTFDHQFSKWVDRIMEIIVIRIFNMIYHNDLIFYNLSIGREFLDLCNKSHDFIKRVIENKKRNFEKIHYDVNSDECLQRKAFLDHLLDINEKEHNVFTDDDLLDETMTFMIAGSDTTATTNCFLFTMLGLHPQIQDKVLQEVLEVLGPNKPIEVSDLPQLQYTERVIKETLRLFPIGTFIVRAIEENIDLGDHIAPKGSSVLFNIRRLHTKETYWPEPFKFNPDRFLPEEVAKRHPCAFIPFSFGPRNCIGMRYAYMAIKALIATMIRKYEIHTSYKNVEDIQVKSNLVTRPTHGFKVSVELREL